MSSDGGPQPLRVLHVLPDLRTGGGQGVVANLVRHRDPDAVEYVIASLDAPYDLQPAFEDYGAPTVRLDLGSRGAAAVMRGLVQTIRNHRIDVVHVHSGPDRKYAQAAALLTGRPVIGHLHSPWNHRGSMAGQAASVLARAKGHTKAIVRDGVERMVVREYVSAGDQVTAFHEALSHRSITTVRNGISVGDYAPASGPQEQRALRERLGVPSTGEVLVCVGRLVDGKGQDALIEMLQHLEGASLLLVGDGPRRATLEGLADRSGVAARVHFLGDRADVPALLAASDVFVFSSETEGLPLSVLEAMAAALPVVAVTLPGLVGLVVDGETGCLVERADPAELAVAVADLLADSGRRRAMGAAARTLVTARHDARQMAASVEEIYLRCAGEAAAKKIS